MPASASAASAAKASSSSCAARSSATFWRRASGRLHPHVLQPRVDGVPDPAIALPGIELAVGVDLVFDLAMLRRARRVGHVLAIVGVHPAQPGVDREPTGALSAFPTGLLGLADAAIPGGLWPMGSTDAPGGARNPKVHGFLL
jgi:hypothetical protein